MNVHSKSRSPSSQRGLSLIELIISISLGLFLTWGATQSFLVGKQTYSMQQALSRIQENGRMAHEFMAYDIRNAGSIGCGSRLLLQNASSGNGCSNGVSMTNNPTSVDYYFGRIVYGVNDTPNASNLGQTFAGPGLVPAPKANTDVLLVRGVSAERSVELSGDSTPTGSGNFSVTMTSNDGGGCFSGICPNDIVALTDCAKAKIFQVTNMGGGTAISHAVSAVNQCAVWSGSSAFKAGAQLYRMYNNFYYIAENAANRPALYTAGINGVGTELLEGVEDMQIEYGIGSEDVTPCTTAGVTGSGYIINQWKSADQVTAAEWDAWDEQLCTATPRRAVVAVRYSLLMRSEEWVLDAPQAYNFNGVDYVGGVQGTTPTAASDRRLRQIFTTTVSVRNQVK